MTDFFAFHLSEVAAACIELALSSLALAPLVADVIKTIEPLATKNSNKVSVPCADDMGTMFADQMRLQQALDPSPLNKTRFMDLGRKSCCSWFVALEEYAYLV